MDTNFIDIVDNIYERTFVDRIFLNDANHISQDQFLDAIAGSALGNLFAGGMDMFEAEEDENKNSLKA